MADVEAPPAPAPEVDYTRDCPRCGPMMFGALEGRILVWCACGIQGTRSASDEDAPAENYAERRDHPDRRRGT